MFFAIISIQNTYQKDTKMLSKGYIKSLSLLALSRAFLVSSTRVEEEDLLRDGLIDRPTIEELRDYRSEIANRINNFLIEVYKANSSQRGTIQKTNNKTVDKAMRLIYKQLIDMDYVAIYLLEKIHYMPKTKEDIKSLIDMEQLKQMKSLVEKTYTGEIKDKKYISKFEHIALINKIVESI